MGRRSRKRDKRFASVHAMLSDLGWDKLADRRRNRRLILFYQIYHQDQNLIAITYEEVDFVKNSRPSRKHSKQLIKPRVGLKSTVRQTISDWNSLDRKHVRAGFDIFKNQLAAAAAPEP